MHIEMEEETLNQSLLIFEPFNACFFIVTFIIALFGFIFIKLLKNKTDAQKRKAVAILYIVIFAVFIAYKIILSHDAAYDQIRADAGLGGFNWWEELPLNLCNINIILIIIGCLANSKLILGFNFFIGTLGALMATLMPCVGFTGYSILLPRMLGYYVTHMVVALQLPIIAGLNLYRPKFKDLPKIVALLLGIVAVIVGINFAIKGLGLSDHVNYFYTMSPDGNPILELFMKWIPYPGLYVLPGLLILVPYMIILTGLFNIPKKRKN